MVETDRLTMGENPETENNSTEFVYEEYKKRSNTGDDVYVRIRNDADEKTVVPTAILFGWLGSKPKHVSKYANLYENMGYNVIYTTAPASVTFPLAPRIVTKYVLSVLRIIASDRRLLRGGLVFHMFSNGGAMCAPFLARLLMGNFEHVVHSDDKVIIKTVRDVISGIVFDSGPVNLRNDLGADAICHSLGITNYVLRLLVWMLFTLVCFLQQVFIVDLRKEFWDAINAAEYFCPEVYIYSRVDKVLDVTALETLIERRKQTGHDVRTFAVEEGGHVRILSLHPHHYSETLKQLNDDGLNTWRTNHQLPAWSVKIPALSQE